MTGYEKVALGVCRAVEESIAARRRLELTIEERDRAGRPAGDEPVVLGQRGHEGPADDRPVAVGPLQHLREQPAHLDLGLAAGQLEREPQALPRDARHRPAVLAVDGQAHLPGDGLAALHREAEAGAELLAAGQLGAGRGREAGDELGAGLAKDSLPRLDAVEPAQLDQAVNRWADNPALVLAEKRRRLAADPRHPAQRHPASFSHSSKEVANSQRLPPLD